MMEVGYLSEIVLVISSVAGLILFFALCTCKKPKTNTKEGGSTLEIVANFFQSNGKQKDKSKFSSGKDETILGSQDNGFTDSLLIRPSTVRIMKARGLHRLVWQDSIKMDRKSLINQHQSFYNSRQHSTDRYSALLTGRLSQSINIRSGLGLIDIAEHKRSIRISALHPKNASIRLSDNFDRLDELMGLSFQTDSAHNLSATFNDNTGSLEVNTLLDKVVARLDEEILTIKEVMEVSQRGKLFDLTQNTTEDLPSIKAYLSRMMQGLNNWFHEEEVGHTMTGVRCLLLSLVYLKRLKEVETNFVLTQLNVHSIFAVMMLTAAKFSEDVVLSQSYWAEVCGVELSEITELEKAFCISSGFNFFVTSEDLASIYEEFGLKMLAENVRHAISVRPERLTIVFSTNMQSLGLESVESEVSNDVNLLAVDSNYEDTVVSSAAYELV